MSSSLKVVARESGDGGSRSNGGCASKRQRWLEGFSWLRGSDIGGSRDGGGCAREWGCCGCEGA